MKQTRILSMAVLIGLTLASLASCGPDYLSDQLAALNNPPGLETSQARALTEEEVAGSETAEDPIQSTNSAGQPVTYTATTKRYRASASFDTQVLLNPSTDVIYPGSVLLGHTIDDGSYQEVTRGTKKGITVSYDLTGVSTADGTLGVVSGTIVPSLSNFRELHNQIMSQTITGVSTIYSYTCTDVSTEEAFGMKVDAGAGFSSPTFTASVKAGFDYQNSRTTNKLLVQFMQTFYTVDVDQGQGTFIYESFDLDDFDGYRPVYVSSIAYGRLAYMTIETTESKETITAYLNAIFESASYGNYDAALDTNYQNLTRSSTITVTAIGATDVATDASGFAQMLQDDGFSAENPGKIVSYKLRFVDDNSVANTVFNGEYTLRTVSAQLGQGIRIGLRVTNVSSQVDDAGGEAEFNGNLNFVANSSTSHGLWNYSSSGNYEIGEVSSNAYNGTLRTHVFANTSDAFTIELKGLTEDDFTGDDKFRDVTLSKTVADIENGGTITLKSFWDSGNEWVEFTIATTKELLY